MMKKAFYLCLLISSCLFACRTPPSSQQEFYTGSFRSMKGVFNPISCYCGNGGYLQTELGETIPICLKENQEVLCPKIRVSGRFMSQASPKESTSPCPQESMNIFRVATFECQP